MEYCSVLAKSPALFQQFPETTSMATKFQLLQQLPEELLQEVLDSVGSAGLRRFQFTSRWCYEKAAEWLWREVELVDCPTERNERGVERDDHDDTPIVKKLVLLAT